MNVFRFIRKCLFDREAAVESAALVSREWRGRLHWAIKPSTPLTCRLKGGGVLLLDSKHSFTHCFWPGVHFYEPDLQAYFSRAVKPGMTFIDCGANVGLFSVMAGALVESRGRVVSIEANPTTLQLLARNLAHNNLPQPIHCALSDHVGTLDLYLPEQGDVFSTTRPNAYVDASSPTVSVPCGRLDDILDPLDLDRVDMIKIDVEGAEMDVLNGAHETLQKHRPTLVVEYGTTTWPSFEHSHAELIKLADNYVYDLAHYDVVKHELVPVTDEQWNSGYTNIILTPR